MKTQNKGKQQNHSTVMYAKYDATASRHLAQHQDRERTSLAPSKGNKILVNFVKMSKYLFDKAFILNTAGKYILK